MIYAIHLIELGTAESAAFTAAFDTPGGLWPTLAGTLTGHIHTQLMAHASNPGSYLILEFWESEESYERGQKSPQEQALHQWLRMSTRSHQEIGVFQFLRDDKSSDQPRRERGMPRQHAGQDSKVKHSLDECIEVLELWPKAQYRLRDPGIDHISDLVVLDEDKLQKIGLTPEWIDDIKEILGKLGLQLGM